MHQKVCSNPGCNKVFTRKDPRAMYCSSYCKVQAFKKRSGAIPGDQKPDPVYGGDSKKFHFFFHPFLKGKDVAYLMDIRDAVDLLLNHLNNEGDPSYDLALFYGVKELSYRHPKFGFVWSYAGEAIIKMADGRIYRAVGHEDEIDKSDPDSFHEGYIQFTRIS